MRLDVLRGFNSEEVTSTQTLRSILQMLWLFSDSSSVEPPHLAVPILGTPMMTVASTLRMQFHYWVSSLVVLLSLQRQVLTVESIPPIPIHWIASLRRAAANLPLNH